MSTFEGLLMRDVLADDGTVPSPGYPYYSPDLINHAQVTNPETYFAANYSTDPNEPAERGSRTNRIYVRAKNLSESTKSGYYVSVYRAKASLFLKPSIWKDNKLRTRAGDSYVQLDTVAAGEVVAGATPFLLDAVTSTNYCLIGIASTEKDPQVPGDFATYDDYVLWVRQNQNICGRNLRMVQNYPDRSYSQIDDFSNPGDKEVPTLFQTVVTGQFPSDTTFGVTCAPLDLDASWNLSEGRVQTDSKMTPAHFDGNVTTWVTLPDGISWPEGGAIETTVYVGVDEGHPAAEFAEREWRQFRGRRPRVLGTTRHLLVRLGNCGSRFVTDTPDRV